MLHISKPTGIVYLYGIVGGVFYGMWAELFGQGFGALQVWAPVRFFSSFGQEWCFD